MTWWGVEFVGSAYVDQIDGIALGQAASKFTDLDPRRPCRSRPAKQPGQYVQHAEASIGANRYLHAVTMISTSTAGAAISDCTQARTGAPSAGSHGVQTSFIAPRSLMSLTQMTACSRRVL